jgi:hypothetical protein
VTLVVLRPERQHRLRDLDPVRFVAIGAGISEFFAIAASTTGWKIAHGILRVIFIAAGSRRSSVREALRRAGGDRRRA